MNLAALRFLCTSMNVTTLSYGHARRDIIKYGFQELAEKNNAFCSVFGYRDDPHSVRYQIFYNARLPEEEIKYAIAQELGHIVLGHIVVHGGLDKITSEMKGRACQFADLLLRIYPYPYVLSYVDAEESE